MDVTLFYFSATGNSLTTARLLASELGNCRLVGLASLIDQKEILVETEAVGFVFPIYYSDMPYLMRHVIGQMNFKVNPYIFSVCTCKGHYGEIAQRLDSLLRSKGQKLSFSRHVYMPGNSSISTPEQNIVVLNEQKENVRKVAQEISGWPVENYQTETEPELTPVHVASNLRGLEAEETCVGCGVCETVCPMGNIHLSDGKPVFGEDCCSCLSCFHWCPSKAIWMPKGKEEVRRRFQYHHPDVIIKDIVEQKSK